MKTTVRLFLIIPAVVGIGFLSKSQAVVPPPDGCYPAFTTAEGCKTLQSLTSGLGNTGFGWYSLFANSTGSYNTAVGAGALDLNTGDNNTATGAGALLLNTTGRDNTATGVDALVFNHTGTFNTANGAFALFSNTDGESNSAFGWSALQSNTIGDHNTATGIAALFGNTSGTENTADGANALQNNTMGNDNTATGLDALFDNSIGSDNTANGAHALESNTTANANTAMGSQALQLNTSGDGNTAIGYQTLLISVMATDNTAVGHTVLSSNTTGSSNSGFGSGALISNAGGGNNTASGYQALFSNTGGSGNTATGFKAIYSNIGGNGNTGIGYGALVAQTGGDFNTALGLFAGNGITTASSVICIGTSGVNINDSCFIGNIWNQTGGSQAVYVNSDGKLGAQVSSLRFKANIKPMEEASQMLYSLKPVTFRYKKEIDPTGTPQLGLVAEDVQKVNPSLVIRDNEGKPYSVRYDQVNAMLLNEFLKEHRKVQELEANAARQQKQIEALTAGLQQVSARVQASKFATGRIRGGGPAPQVVNNP